MTSHSETIALLRSTGWNDDAIRYELTIREHNWRVFVRMCFDDPEGCSVPHILGHWKSLTESDFAFIIAEEYEAMAKEPTLNKDGKPRKPRSTSTKATAAEVEMISMLSQQLKFVGVAHDDKGEPYAQHCVINQGSLIAFNGVLAAGIMIAEKHIYAAPNTLQLRKAIERAGPQYSMTTEANFVTIKAGKFRASVPTLDPASLPQVVPDACGWPIDNKVRDALKAASAFASDNAPTVLVASIQMTNGSCAGTDRKVMLEFYHGHPFPNLTVPKEFATAIVKCDKEIIGFGFTPDVSLTFWFVDGSFIKTQLYSEAWPENWQGHLPTSIPNGAPLPDVFWQAYDAISDFSEDELIRYRGDIAHSHQHQQHGATYETKDLGHNWTLNVKRLKMIRNYVEQIGMIREGVLGFFGKDVRGIIALFQEEGNDVPETAPPLVAQFAGAMPSYGANPYHNDGPAGPVIDYQPNGTEGLPGQPPYIPPPTIQGHEYSDTDYVMSYTPPMVEGAQNAIDHASAPGLPTDGWQT